MSCAIRTEQLRKIYGAPPRDDAIGRPRRGGGAASGSRGTTSIRGPARGDGPRSGGVVALAGLDLEIPEGEFFGLLGPNGAGKTTTIGILTTRVRATSGTATVAGADLETAPVMVRQRIGVVPQRPNPDRSLSVLENLVFHAAYFGVGRSEATNRAFTLLEQFGIVDRAAAKVDEMSGGQQQRLMIARALIHAPRVIFLDEPTVGLDPQARHALWDILRSLHADGRTIVMTTHYMEEAEQLCDRLAIVDGGRLLALDTPAELKARAPGGTMVELTLDGDAELVVDAARAVPGLRDIGAHERVLRAYSARGGQVIPALIDTVQGSGRTVLNIHLAPPSLETLFIALTGRTLEASDEAVRGTVATWSRA